MKKMYFLVFLAVSSCTLTAQQNGLDDFFNKYSDDERFTSVKINGNLLGFISKFDDDPDLDNLANKITSIRILSTDKETQYPGINFYEEIKDDIKKENFEELMTVRDSGDNVQILVKTKGEEIRDLLIVVSGDSQTVIQVSGTLNRDDLTYLSKTNIERLDCLEALESDVN